MGSRGSFAIARDDLPFLVRSWFGGPGIVFRFRGFFLSAVVLDLGVLLEIGAAIKKTGVRREISR